MPKVSVIMPVYNGGEYISESIDSVLAQNRVDLELIVVNDGSTDNTLEILKSYEQKDLRVRVITRPNSGRPSFPKNDGIAATRGEYVCFLDHDDLYDADRTWQLVAGLDTHPDWIAAFHDLRLIDSRGEKLPGTYLSGPDFLGRASPFLTSMADDWFECSELLYIYQSLQMGAPHTQSILIAIKRVPAGTVAFDTQFTICDDTDLWIRLSLLGKFGYLNRVLSSYRQHDASITRNFDKFRSDWLKMHQNNYKRVGERLSSTQLRQYRAKISAGIADLGYFRYQQFHQREARVAYREALSWFTSQEAAIGYLKTFIPEGVLRWLKRTITHNSNSIK